MCAYQTALVCPSSKFFTANRTKAPCASRAGVSYMCKWSNMVTPGMSMCLFSKNAGICLRQFHSSSIPMKGGAPTVLRGIDISKILREDPKKQSNKQPNDERVYNLPRTKLGKIKSLVTGPILNKKYQDRSRYPAPTQAEISHSNHFFNLAKKKLNWLIYKYEDIPGERERLAKEEELAETEVEEAGSLIEKLEGEEVSTELTMPFYDDFETDEVRSENEENRQAKIIKKQEIIAEKNTSPEVLFVGRCNVGKSSLINGLFNDLSKKIPTLNYAKVKNFPGLTPSMNFYNVGGLFRVVDSPGYGMKGKPWQGDLILHYIVNRRNLRKVYILVSLKDGVKETDDQLIDFLVENRIPFDFIITKIDKLVDKLSRDQYMHRLDTYLMPSLQIDNPVLQPNFHFVNNVASKVRKVTGLEEVRVEILKACGFEKIAKLKPLIEVNPLDLNQKMVTKVGDMNEHYLQIDKEQKKALKKALKEELKQNRVVKRSDYKTRELLKRLRQSISFGRPFYGKRLAQKYRKGGR